MIEWEGNIIKKRDREQIFLSDTPKENAMIAFVQILSAKLAAIKQVLKRSDHVLEEKVQPYWMPITRASYEVSSVLDIVSPMLNYETIYIIA